MKMNARVESVLDEVRRHGEYTMTVSAEAVRSGKNQDCQAFEWIRDNLSFLIKCEVRGAVYKGDEGFYLTVKQTGRQQ